MHNNFKIVIGTRFASAFSIIGNVIFVHAIGTAMMLYVLLDSVGNNLSMEIAVVFIAGVSCNNDVHSNQQHNDNYIDVVVLNGIKWW